MVARLVLATETPGATGGLALCAAVGVAAAADPERSVLVVEVGAERVRRPTMLASAAARALESSLRRHGLPAAARGRVCWLGLRREGWRAELDRVLSVGSGPEVAVAFVPGEAWDQARGDGRTPDGVLLRGDPRSQRSLCALAYRELASEGIRARIATRALGPVAARRALAGLDPGGAAARRVTRLAQGLGLVRVAPRPRQSVRGEGERVAEAGQALPLALGGALAVLVAALAFVAIGGAVSGTARAQRATDVAAISAARSMRDDLPRLLAPERLASGAPNPAHLDHSAYLAHATSAARQAAERNGVDADRLRVSFPDGDSFPVLRVRVELRSDVNAGGRRIGATQTRAEAEAALPATYDPSPPLATGGGYSGPLAYRQGKPMRPDVAAAFDRMAAAARRSGIGLVVTSAFRSDAEQARLYAQNPDPRWVAPPGHSLHRCATELDLGPASAYGWLHANAPRFGFLQRYSWEPWHFGFNHGPAPCSAAGDALRGGNGDGRLAATGLPAFVPAAFRGAIERSAARWGVSAGLLAAQLMAESGFNPRAVSPAGAQGIAQFMPATAGAYGLRDPFDPDAAIDAQAHLMADLLRQLGSVPLALAAYNAGAGPVAACECIPPYPETQAYVARILTLMGGAGELVTPTLEVRLVG
jgi:soluble lytic murein transglycosylase-like protein